jgi:hypothetical protein
VIHLSLDLARTLSLNCPEFPDSCRLLEFTLLVDIVDVFADRANIFLKQAFPWPSAFIIDM